MTDIFILIACMVLGALCIFQFFLAAGAPLGRFAWGGAHTVLPARLRVASVFSIGLYLIFAVFILSKASLVELIDNESIVNTGMWIFTVYFFLGIVMNAISRSRPERMLMTPVALILAVSFLVVLLA